ncbi:hypothetical protein [Rhodanobacter sp. DHG33]|uniref:hypothetical protein n=1 Tax=Rhodanobacter sp. DHG33 TaxID=2775921 RepID=UPI0017831E78|nr:hypothetical protein [Rhodanobacter sp. DHG33]MBD8900196.1 hypothetical protein [Rhodanobacter sp. DHG33]
MIGSRFFKIIIGLIIFLVAMVYQNGKLKRIAPSLDDFSHPIEISGIYSYEAQGRGSWTRVGDKGIYCGVNYSGAGASCMVPLANVPENSRISVSASPIKTSDGVILYANSVRFNGKEIYAEPPEESLNNWWFGSRLQSLMLPFVIVVLYVLIICAFFTNRE